MQTLPKQNIRDLVEKVNLAPLKIPIYLEPEIAAFVNNMAQSKQVDVNQIVNMLLKKDKELIEYGTQTD